MIILNCIDWVLFILLALCVCYLLIFAIASLFFNEKEYPETVKKHHFLIIFPAYAEDSVIVNSIKTFLQQDYPKEFYQVVTISDHQEEETNKQLRELPITTIIATYQNSSKAKALTLAIDTIQGNFDAVVVLDADNLAPNNFLSEINKMLVYGIQVIQVHRKGIMSSQSQISLLDGVSEEINNGFFRKGHQVLGLSSALTGSGMIFEYTWFKDNIRNASTSGEDKELESMLLRQRIKVTYSDRLYVYDKKTDKQDAIGNQRKRWIAAQFHALAVNIPNLPNSIITKNFSYVDKIFQWMLPPRLIQIGAIFCITIIVLLIDINTAYKWILLCIAEIVAMILPIPKEYWNKQLLHSLIKIPQLAIKVFLNLFKLKGSSNTFSHTKH